MSGRPGPLLTAPFRPDSARSSRSSSSLPARCAVLLALLGFLSACTVIHYPRTWDPGQPLASVPATAAPVAPPITLQSQAPPPGTAPRGLLPFATSLIGSRPPLEVDGKQYAFNCSGYVSAVFASIGVDILDVKAPPPRAGMTGVELIYLHVQENGRLLPSDPRPGDLVFFDNTWDRNGDGQLNDELTHIGIVEQLRPDGTVDILHLGGVGVARLRMNLAQREVHIAGSSGQILNDYLRRRSLFEPPGTPHLTGQLFKSYGRLDGLELD